MAKPPKTPPHTDIEGMSRDERALVEAAAETAQDAGKLKLARDEAKGRPPHSGERSRDDRSR